MFPLTWFRLSVGAVSCGLGVVKAADRAAATLRREVFSKEDVKTMVIFTSSFLHVVQDFEKSRGNLKVIGALKEARK